MIDVLVCCFVVALFYVVWRFTKPYDVARVLSFVWCPSLLVAHALIGRPGGLTGRAFLYISALVLLVALGARLARRYVERREVSKKGLPLPLHGSYRVRWLYVVFIASCVVALFGIFSLMWRHGFTFKDFFSFSRLQRMSSYFYDERYGGWDDVAWTSLVSLYLCPLLGGFLFHAAKRKWVVVVISALPALLLLLVSNRKAVLVFAATLFTASYISGVMVSGRRLHLSKRVALRLSAVVIAAVVLFALAFVLRYGKESNFFKGWGPAQIAVNYGVGHTVCFDSFLRDTGWGCDSVKLGTRTLLGPASVLGLESRLSGVYQETFDFTSRGGKLQFTSNVYSAFRPLVEDFTVVGSLLVALLASFFVGIVGERMPRPGSRALRAFRVVCYTAALQYAMYSFITSPWSYNSIVAALLLYFVALALCGRSEKEVECDCERR